MSPLEKARRVFLIPARLFLALSRFFKFIGTFFEAIGDPGKFSD